MCRHTVASKSVRYDCYGFFGAINTLAGGGNDPRFTVGATGSTALSMGYRLKCRI